MFLFCPKCHAQHSAATRCPKCSSRLLSPGEAADTLAVSAAPPPDPVETTYAARLGVGCVVALGLHLALHEWSMAALGDSGGTDHPLGFAVGYILRLVSVIVGGVLAGAGRRVNFSGGATVGLVSGLAWLLVDGYPQIVIDPLRGGLVGVLVVVAGLTAMASGQVWPEAVKIPHAPSPRDSSLMTLKPTNGNRRKNPTTHWMQILAAAALALGGIAVAETARASLRELPAGLLNLGGPLAGPRIDFQLTVIAVVLASAFAGAGTGSGVKHGALAGCLTGFGVFVIRSIGPDGLAPGLDWLAEKTCDSESPPGTVNFILAVLTVASVTLGGWLGGQLFPPIKPVRKQPRIRY